MKVTEPGNIEKTGTGGEGRYRRHRRARQLGAYESVVVRFTDIEITDASKLYEWGAVELAIGCWMDNDFTNYDAEDGASYASITGPISYSFEKYAILPRSTEDLVGYTGTPGGGSGGSDDSETICDDGIDNDGNGYIDCDDWTVKMILPVAEVAEVQTARRSGDGINNDGNGFTDCDDFDCAYDTACAEDCRWHRQR